MGENKKYTKLGCIIGEDLFEKLSSELKVIPTGTNRTIVQFDALRYLYVKVITNHFKEEPPLSAINDIAKFFDELTASLSRADEENKK